jgi:anti-anti-sigma factor
VRALAQVEAQDVEGVRLVAVTGEIDMSNAHDMLDRIGAQVPKDASHVVVDLSGMSFLDSSGVAMLFRLAERLHRSRQQLRLVVPHDAPIRAVIELTAVSRVIAVDAAFPSG